MRLTEDALDHRGFDRVGIEGGFDEKRPAGSAVVRVGRFGPSNIER
jgi:hypothetical protein